MRHPANTPRETSADPPAIGATATSPVEARSRNRLFRLIPDDEYAWLSERAERASWSLGDLIAPPDQPMRHAWFPEDSIASLISPLPDGCVEVGTVGHEGMVGIGLVLGTTALPVQTLCQTSGTALRLTAETLAESEHRCPQFRALLLRYVHAFLGQVAQTAACNRLHDVEQRCARWLLMTDDRTEGQELELTHEFLAYMLGVRRAGVSEAAAGLQRRGLIRYRRGRITVLDRAGLEAAACPCYGVVRSLFDRTFGES